VHTRDRGRMHTTRPRARSRRLANAQLFLVVSVNHLCTTESELEARNQILDVRVRGGEHY